MFKSNMVKVVVVLLVIIGFMQYTAKKTVEKQMQNNAVEAVKAQEHYNQRLLQHNLEKQKISGNLNAEREYHHVLTKIGGYLSSIKNNVILYERKHDKWPEDMTDLGLNSEKSADGRYIQSIKIDNGDIYAFLSEEYGANKIIRLYHVEGRDVVYPWVCATNLRVKEKTTIANALCSDNPDISFNGRYLQ